MRGYQRLNAVNRSSSALQKILPEVATQEAVLIRLTRIGVAGLGDFFDPIFRRLGLTDTSFHVLCLLMANENGQASPSELSEMVATSRANITRILESLVEDQLVSRAVEDHDARRHLIRITPKGKRLASSAVPMLAEPIKRAFSGLDAEELQLLDKLLRKMILSFDKGGEAST